MEILRNRNDYVRLDGRDGSREKAFRESREQAIRQVIGVWIENKKHKDLLAELHSKIGLQLNRRPRKWERRTDPKKRPSVSVSSKNIGNEKTRKIFERHNEEKKTWVQVFFLFF